MLKRFDFLRATNVLAVARIWNHVFVFCLSVCWSVTNGP